MLPRMRAPRAALHEARQTSMILCSRRFLAPLYPQEASPQTFLAAYHRRRRLAILRLAIRLFPHLLERPAGPAHQWILLRIHHPEFFGESGPSSPPWLDRQHSGSKDSVARLNHRQDLHRLAPTVLSFLLQNAVPPPARSICKRSIRRPQNLWICLVPSRGRTSHKHRLRPLSGRARGRREKWTLDAPLLCYPILSPHTLQRPT